jgi:hypothetical protein
MLASSYFKIGRTAKDDWFDAILNADTELFVDPFLVFREKRGFWRTAHDEIIQHFDVAFRLIAEGALNPQTLSYQKALHLLTFREPKELGLGYTAKGTAGAGGGRGYALGIATAIGNAIRRGLEHPRHFEELGILNEGIGADRISDITCTILKRRLIQYTQDVAGRHQIPLQDHTLFASGFDDERLRWTMEPVQLPTNPSTKGPFLFVPERFLRDLPVLNAEDWWESYENQMLREDVNYRVLRNVDKKTIIATAREHPESVRAWTIAREAQSASPYDFGRDPKGVWQWDQAADSFVQANPLVIAPPESFEDFLRIIGSIIRQYKLFIEEQGGWYLLWNKPGDDKPEHAPQLLFRGIAQQYCRANNISLDAEVNLGRGPVDFKFSNGYSKRAHLEIKKLHNGKFWNGIEAQLPSYMASDEVEYGAFLAIRYRDGKAAQARARELPERVKAVAEDKHLNLSYSIIDARPKESASKQKRRRS